MNLETSVGFDDDGALDFKADFGNQGIESPFQDGSCTYLVIPAGKWYICTTSNRGNRYRESI